MFVIWFQKTDNQAYYQHLECATLEIAQKEWDALEAFWKSARP